MDQTQDQEQATSLAKYFITFGMQYSHEDHPIFERAHPDGYVVILAPDRETARRMAWGAFGDRWAFDYDENSFNASLHPLGEIGRITCDMALSTRLRGEA
jgi:hypothetical protein